MIAFGCCHYWSFTLWRVEQCWSVSDCSWLLGSRSSDEPLQWPWVCTYFLFWFGRLQPKWYSEIRGVLTGWLCSAPDMLRALLRKCWSMVITDDTVTNCFLPLGSRLLFSSSLPSFSTSLLGLSSTARWVEFRENGRCC